MQSNERLNLALNHKQPDRIPFDLGGTFTSGIPQTSYLHLCEHLGFQPPENIMAMWDVLQEFGSYGE